MQHSKTATAEDRKSITMVETIIANGTTPIAPQPLPLDAKYENFVMSVRKKTSGLMLCLLGFDANPGMSGTRAGILKVEPEPKSSLQASLEGMATHWFDMEVTASQSWEASPLDIYIANESESSLKSLGSSLNYIH